MGTYSRLNRDSTSTHRSKSIPDSPVRIRNCVQAAGKKFILGNLEAVLIVWRNRKEKETLVILLQFRFKLDAVL